MRAWNVMKQKVYRERRDGLITGFWLKLTPYRQLTVARRPNEKREPQYFRPFKVIKKLGKITYQLQLPETAQTHQVFYISQLKSAIGDFQKEAELPLQWDSPAAPKFQPEDAKKIKPKKDEQRIEVLIKWRGLTKDTTWEILQDIKVQILDFHLEDKLNVMGQ